MATKNKVFTVNFRAFDTAANEPKTGDSANISMFVRIDSGVVSGVTNAVSEVDAVNMPGLYTLQATAAEMNGESILFNGTSTTADVIIDPVYIETEDVVNGVWEDDNTARNTAGSAGKVIGDTLADTDQIQQVTPATLIATQVDVQALSNNTKARISVGDPIQIPDTGDTIFPIDFYFFDSAGVGTPNDPDNNEVAIQIRAINAQVLKTALFDDEAGTVAATASVTFSGFWQLNRLGVGRYQTFYKLPNTETSDQWNLKFQLEESTVLLEYPQNISIVESLSTIELDDSTANKQVIAKALKEEDVSSTAAVSGSIYDDIITDLQSIVSKLPSGTISDFGLTTTTSDGITVDKALKLIASYVNGRSRKDFPAAGKLTYYEQDNTTILTQLNVTDTEVTRDV
jgi:hypothetical protein